MLQELEASKFPDHLLYLKQEVDALPEQDKYVPYHEDDFMFPFSDDKHKICHYSLNYAVQNVQKSKHFVYVRKRKENSMISGIS